MYRILYSWFLFEASKLNLQNIKMKNLWWGSEKGGSINTYFFAKLSMEATFSMRIYWVVHVSALIKIFMKVSNFKDISASMYQLYVSIHSSIYLWMSIQSMKISMYPLLPIVFDLLCYDLYIITSNCTMYKYIIISFCWCVLMHLTWIHIKLFFLFWSVFSSFFGKKTLEKDIKPERINKGSLQK